MRFKGVIPPVTTPFKTDLSIDRLGFGVMIEHLIAAGVDGIIVGGTLASIMRRPRKNASP